jgi:hypothetical protein
MSTSSKKRGTEYKIMAEKFDLEKEPWNTPRE